MARKNTVRVAINGFGRIGRQILQAGINDPDIEWVAVNDLTDTKTLAHLLKYDSVHGISQYPISHDEKHLIVKGKTIKVFAEKEPAHLPWKDLKVDIVLECTGLFRERDLAQQHIKAGAKKVLISAPAKNPDFTVVLGVIAVLTVVVGTDKAKHARQVATKELKGFYSITGVGSKYKPKSFR